MSGEAMPFYYNHNEMINEFSKYVISDEVPFNHGQSHAYDYFIRKVLQPQYKAVPTNTLNTYDYAWIFILKL